MRDLTTTRREREHRIVMLTRQIASGRLSSSEMRTAAEEMRAIQEELARPAPHVRQLLLDPVEMGDKNGAMSLFGEVENV